MNSYIFIDGWKTNIRFSAAHMIPEYEKCGRLHGHTYAVHAKIFGNPDSNGIILDFSILKNSLKQIVNKLDHKILIPKKSKIIYTETEEKNAKSIECHMDLIELLEQIRKNIKALTYGVMDEKIGYKDLTKILAKKINRIGMVKLG